MTNESGGKLNNWNTLINSGTLNNYGEIGASGTYRQTAGLTVNDGSMSQGIIEIMGGALKGTGTITGNVTIGANGHLEPGDSPGMLKINGNLNSSGTIIFQIGGLGAGEFDILKVNGNMNFTGGNIDFDFINGFIPTVGSYWDFLPLIRSSDGTP